MMYTNSVISHAIVITTILFSCGATSVKKYLKPQPKILSGKVATDAQFTHQGYLTYNGELMCSVSIIHPKWLLTGAHCFEDAEPEITIGTNKFSPDSGIKCVFDKFYPHEEFKYLPEKENNGTEYVVNDIGLVHLKKRIVFDSKIKPVKLATDDKVSYDGALAVLAGWGATRFGFDGPEKIMFAEVKVTKHQDCLHDWPYIKHKHFCTSNREGKGVCYGDSGGPLIVNGTQIGIISSADIFCRNKTYNLYTRVSSFIPWIKSTLSKHGDSLP